MIKLQSNHLKKTNQKSKHNWKPEVICHLCACFMCDVLCFIDKLIPLSCDMILCIPCKIFTPKHICIMSASHYVYMFKCVSPALLWLLFAVDPWTTWKLGRPTLHATENPHVSLQRAPPYLQSLISKLKQLWTA